MLKKGYILLFLIGFPSISYLFNTLSAGNFRHRWYITTMLFLYILYHLIGKGIIYRRPLKIYFIKPFLFLFSFIIINNIIFNFLISYQKSYLYILINNLLIPLFSISLMIYMNLNKEKVEIILKDFTQALGIIIAFFFLISIYQSLLNIQIIHHVHYHYTIANIASRDITNMFGDSLLAQLGLKKIFQGLFQHHLTYAGFNAIANIFFIYQFKKSGHKKYLFFSLLSFLAIVGSTSRSSFIAYLVSTSYFFYKNLSKKIKVLLLLLLILSVYFIFFIFSPNLFNSINSSQYFTLTNTLMGRVKLWGYFMNVIYNFDLVSFIFGLTPSQFNIVINKNYFTGSTENQFFSIFLQYGIICLTFLIWFFIDALKRRIDFDDTVALRSMTFTILIIILFSPLLIQYEIIGLITLFYTALYIKEKRKLSDTPQSMLSMLSMSKKTSA